MYIAYFTFVYSMCTCVHLLLIVVLFETTIPKTIYNVTMLCIIVCPQVYTYFPTCVQDK